MTGSMSRGSRLAAVLFPLLAVPALADPPGDNLPPLSPLPLPKPIPPPVPLTRQPLADIPGTIGYAEMDGDGTIHLHLSAPHPAPAPSLRPAPPWPAPQERIGYGEIDVDRADPYYRALLHHLGGIEPGEAQPVPLWRPGEEWHCAIDPDRGDCPMIHLLPGAKRI